MTETLSNSESKILELYALKEKLMLALIREKKRKESLWVGVIGGAIVGCIPATFTWGLLDFLIGDGPLWYPLIPYFSFAFWGALVSQHQSD
jgi:hypothetical protein